MLQRDGLFRRREESLPRSPSAAPQPAPPATPSAPLPAAASTVVAKPPIVEKPVEQPHERKEARLTVGPEIKMKGAEIIDCDTLVVEGRLEATLDTRVLQIAEHGAFNGVVSVDVAEIHGRLDGELTARKQLIIHATAKVSGKIRYQKIQVSEGAEISGEIGTLEHAPASTVRTGQAAFAGQRSGSSS